MSDNFQVARSTLRGLAHHAMLPRTRYVVCLLALCAIYTYYTIIHVSIFHTRGEKAEEELLRMNECALIAFASLGLNM